MHDRGGVGKETPHDAFVTRVSHLQPESGVGGQGVDRLGAVEQRVQDDDVVADVEQCRRQPRPDVAGAADDEDGGFTDACLGGTPTSGRAVDGVGLQGLRKTVAHGSP
jgi:hypothetical protein